MSRTGNIAFRLEESARQFPHKRALVFPRGRDTAGRVAYTHLTFAQLEKLAGRYAWGLRESGISEGTKTLLMVRLSLDFTALAFALFKLGAIPVMIDPGMGVRGFLNCVRQVGPEGFIGIPRAHILRLLCRHSFRSVAVPVTLGRCWFWGGRALASLPRRDEPFPAREMNPDDLAAILFTSGSTGPAKGVEYTHRIFETQVDILAQEFGITPDQTDLPCFPLFGLFSTGLGCTAVIPDMNPTRPADVNPERIVEAATDHGVTYSFGSPALWAEVGRYCKDHGIRLPTLERIYMSGAPVPAHLHRLLLDNVVGENGDTFAPYGATECLPVACLSGREVLRQTAEKSERGAGICVGRPVAAATVRIIAISDDPIAAWHDSLLMPDGEIGEIVVSGPMVTPAYYARDEQTRSAKIPDRDRIWHRIGDLGYFDGDGRLWMCGRKGHRVETAAGMLCTVCCEAIFNAHDAVARSALVGIGGVKGRQIPVIVVELASGQGETKVDRNRIRQDLMALAGTSRLTVPVQHILFHPAFPVDVRHNAKINREKLSRFAAAKLGLGVCRT